MSLSISAPQLSPSAARDLPAPSTGVERDHATERAPQGSPDAARLDVSDATQRQRAIEEIAAQNRAASASAVNAATAATLVENLSAQINSPPGAATQSHVVDPQRVAALLT